MSDNEDRSQRHKRAMQRKKAHVDQRIAQATKDKNLNRENLLSVNSRNYKVCEKKVNSIISA